MTDRPPLQLLMGSPVGAGCGLSRAGMSGVMVEVGGWRWVGGGGGAEVAALVGLQHGAPVAVCGK